MPNERKLKNALLLQTPGGNKTARYYPSGLLAVGKILRDHGVNVKIVDLCLESNGDLFRLAKEMNPDLVGFGGIATSYGAVNEISSVLRKHFSDALYIAGGPLASTYELLLEDGAVDYVFHGEVEKSMPKFIEFVEAKRSLEEIGGISFKAKNGRIYRAVPEPQIENLDEVGIPDYTLINADKYIADLKDWYAAYSSDIDAIGLLKSRVRDIISSGRTRYLESNTSRGCTHRCTFCYRHMKGIRRHSVKYTIEEIRHLKINCNIDGVLFTDELFNNDIKWIYELCDGLDNSGLNLSFYMVAGMRADRLDENLLRRMSASKFIWIVLGQESGSDTVLKYYGKGVTRQQNIDATRLIRKCGIYPSVQLVIGSPAETSLTIRETCDFLKAVDARTVSINYLVPLPGTPIWDYVIKRGYIRDIRAYLNRVRVCGPNFTLGLNLSKANKFTWMFWRVLLKRAVCLNRYRNNFFMSAYYKYFLFMFEGRIRRIFAWVRA